MKKYLITGGNGFIGTNLVETIRELVKDASVHIVDIKPPKIELNSNEVWHNTDIMDVPKLMADFEAIKPDYVVHLAAETDCAPHLVMEDYLVNTQGSKNVFDAAQKSGVSFLVNTSTQYVNQSGNMPTNDTDYAPHTIYGESKIKAEEILRDGNYTFNWVIIRPTNVWGKYHLRYPYEFWKVLRDGKYFHPGKAKVVRSYGYVGTICDQILGFISKENDERVNHKAYYVGDKPIYLYEWVNSFSKAITGKPARVVPSGLIYMLAVFGSILQKVRIGFPITLSRYASMTSDNPAPMEPTLELLGDSRYTMDQGVKITTDWLKVFWKK